MLRRVILIRGALNGLLRRLGLVAGLHFEPRDEPRFRGELPLRPRLGDILNLVVVTQRGDEPRLGSRLPAGLRVGRCRRGVDAIGGGEGVGAHRTEAVTRGLRGELRGRRVRAEVQRRGD